MDRYSKFILTVIAIGVWAHLAVRSGEVPFGSAQAQTQAAPTRVYLAGADGNVVVQVGFQRPVPVITYGSGSPTQSPSSGVAPPR